MAELNDSRERIAWAEYVSDADDAVPSELAAYAKRSEGGVNAPLPKAINAC
jgi:hypothetical protein